MAPKPKPVPVPEVSSNKRQKPNEPDSTIAPIMPPINPPVVPPVPIPPTISPTSQPSTSPKDSTPENNVDLRGIQLGCFGSDGKQLPKVNATFQIVAVTEGPNGVLVITGWDTEKEHPNLKYANQPPMPTTQLLWSVVQIDKKKGLSPNVTITELSIIKTAEEMTKKKHKTSQSKMPEAERPTLNFIKDMKNNQLIDIQLQVQNASNLQELSSKSVYRYMLTDKVDSINLTVWENQFDDWPLHAFEMGKFLQFKQVKVINKPQYLYAATHPYQILLTKGASEINISDEPFTNDNQEQYIKLAEVKHVNLTSETRFMVLIEEIQAANKKIKGNEYRTITIRDESIEEGTTVILRGPPAVIFDANVYHHEVPVMKGLHLVDGILESIPKKFMWYMNNDMANHQLKEWKDAQLSDFP